MVGSGHFFRRDGDDEDNLFFRACVARRSHLRQAKETARRRRAPPEAADGFHGIRMRRLFRVAEIYVDSVLRFSADPSYNIL